jgi:hypothetical protein
VIPSIVKVPVSVAQQVVVTVARGGVGVASAVLHRVLTGGDVEREARSRTTTEASPVDDIAPSPPHVVAEPVTQPPAPERTPTPGATTTVADPAPATATPATRATAKRATARKGPVKPRTVKKAPASAVAKKTPARKASPTKPAATLDDPVAPIDDDPVVYSTGPDVV